MKNLILLLCLTSLLCFSCKKEVGDPDPGPDSSAGAIIAEAKIGEAGGTLESEEVILTIPAGALDTTLSLVLYLEEDMINGAANQVTATYHLTGLNSPWSKPLELAVKYDGNLEGESYLSLGYSYYDMEQEDSILVNELFEAVDSSGFLRCLMGPLELEDLSKSALADHPVKFHPVVFHTRLMLRGLSNMGTVRSECAKIRYEHVPAVDRSKVEQFAAYMDEAAHFFHSMGIMHVDYFRGKSKIRVQILDDPKMSATDYFIETDVESVMESLSLGKEYLPWLLLQTYLYKIQASYFGTIDDAGLKALAALGVLRFDNNCYFGDKKNWLLWAIQYWVKEYFHGSYPGTLQHSMFMHPFYGLNLLNMEKGLHLFPSLKPGTLENQHGMGMAPLVKYLMAHHNDKLDLMKKLYMEMENPASFRQPISALLSSLDVPEYTWWPGFMKAYLSGEVRNITGEMFINEIDSDDELNFNDAGDTLMYFDRTYPDLSTGLCKVNLSKSLAESVLEDEDKLHFQLGPESLNMDYVKVLVFEYKDGKLEFLAEGREVTLDQIKARTKGNSYHLLAAVVNSANEAPYEGELGIELSVRILRKKAWPWQYLSFKAVVTDALLRSGTDQYTWQQFEFTLPDQVMNVSEDGSRFSASWLDQTTEYKYEGGMDVSMDLETYCITGFHMWKYTENYSDGEITLKERFEMISHEGLAIPVVYWGEVFANHQVLKEEACAGIKSFTYEHSLYPGTQNEFSNTLDTYTCEEGTELLFMWANRPMGVLSGK